MTNLVTLVPVGAFLATLAAMAAIRSWFHARALVGEGPAVPRPVVVEPVRTPRIRGFLGRLARPWDPGEAEAQERLILQAGIRSPTAYATFLATRTVLGVAGFVAGGILAWGMAPLTLVVAVTLAGGAGYLLPLAVVTWRAEVRGRRMRRAVPNLLDMLVSCVDAGLGVDAALRHVAAEIAVASPELGEEFDRVNAQVSAGLSRTEALEGLQDRTGVEELGGLAHVIGVVDRMGAGIARSLRAHAQLTRRRRALEAEERAAAASPKLTVAMVLFILPPLFVVLLGGAIARLVVWVFPAIQGGSF